MPKSQIYLLFSNSGGGHRSATDAIHAALDELLIETKLTNNFQIKTDTLVENSHPLNRWFVGIYNLLLRHSQASVKHYYRLIHFLKPNDSSFGYWITGPYIKRTIGEARPAVVVAIHPMINQYLPKAIKNCGLEGQTRFITVVTDPNERIWKGWACPDGDLTIVPNELVKNKLVSWGVPEEKVRVVGMPVHPDFIKPPRVSRGEYLRKLGLDPDTLTVCINSGWAGGGNMMAIYKALSGVRRKIQVVFLSGHNDRLREKALVAASEMGIATVVLPFTSEMSELMNAVDLMVTKAGGLTTFEAISRRLPIAIDMITPPMPQEAGNVDLLLNASLAKPITDPGDIVALVEAAKPDPDRLSRPLPKVYNLDKTGAAYEIAKIILEFGSSKQSQVFSAARGFAGGGADERIPKVVGLQ
jgi:UDP-N-acetylglucosamine:LPS N-acetylglucosamine transferase